MDIEKTLQEIGLEKKEVKVYMALLQLGQDTAFRIAAKAGLKRPTVYVILDRLQEVGLVSSAKTKKATLFSPVEPAKLHNLFQEKEKKLKTVLPSLEALYNVRPEKPKVEMFEGQEGMKAVLYDAISHLKKGEEVIFFSGIEHAEKYYGESLNAWKAILRKDKNTRARELLNDGPIERSYAKEMSDIQDRHIIRFIPKSFPRTNAQFVMFGNKIVVAVPHKEIFATVIENEEVVSAFRILFEMAWKAGKKPEMV